MMSRGIDIKIIIKFIVVFFVLLSLSSMLVFAAIPTWRHSVFEIYDSSLGKSTGWLVDGQGCDVAYCIYHPFYNSSATFAKNGTSGAVDYSGTDAATVVNNAINAIPTGTIKFFGIFNLTAAITVQGAKYNMKLYGYGAKLYAINTYGNYNIINIKRPSATGIRPNHITVEGFTINQSANRHAISVLGADNVIIRDMNISNTFWHGIESDYNNNLVIENNNLNHIGAIGIYVGIDFSLTNNVSQNVKIVNNNINDTGWEGSHDMEGIFTDGCYGCVITGNTISNSTRHGIGIYNFANMLTISNNNINSSSAYGIRIQGRPLASDTVNIIGNNINGGTVGIGIVDKVGTIIQGNHVSNMSQTCGLVSLDSAIPVKNDNTIFDTNVFDTCGNYGVQLIGNSSIFLNLTQIRGNIINNTVIGIYNNLSSNMKATSNVFTNFTTAIQNLNGSVVAFDNYGVSPYNHGVTTNTGDVTAFGFGDTVGNSSSGMMCYSSAAGTANWRYMFNGTAGC